MLVSQEVWSPELHRHCSGLLLCGVVLRVTCGPEAQRASHRTRLHQFLSGALPLGAYKQLGCKQEARVPARRPVALRKASANSIPTSSSHTVCQMGCLMQEGGHATCVILAHPRMCIAACTLQTDHCLLQHELGQTDGWLAGGWCSGAPDLANGCGGPRPSHNGPRPPCSDYCALQAPHDSCDQQHRVSRPVVLGLGS